MQTEFSRSGIFSGSGMHRGSCRAVPENSNNKSSQILPFFLKCNSLKCFMFFYITVVFRTSL